MSTHLMTPRWPETDTREQMQVNDDDFAEVVKVSRTLDWEVAITDQVTGKRYLIRGAECGLPGCNCDAVIVREMRTN